MSVRPLYQYPQPQNTARPVSFFQPLPSCQELIAQMKYSVPHTTSLEGRAGQHPFHDTEAVFSSPTRVETVDTGSSLTSPVRGFASKRRLDMSDAVFPLSKRARTEDLPIATGPAITSIALQGIRREISHDTILLDKKYENEAPFEEKLEKITVTYPNGRTYSGQFKNGLFHCYGKLTFANGKIYIGDFKKGKMHGFGKLIFSNGEYVGEFNDGKFHGQGTLTLDGTTFVGEFRDGLVYGEGMMTYTDGRPPIVSFFSQEPS